MTDIKLQQLVMHFIWTNDWSIETYTVTGVLYMLHLNSIRRWGTTNLG